MTRQISHAASLNPEQEFMASFDRRDFIRTGALLATAGLLSEKASAQAASTQSFAGSKSYSATASPRPWTNPQRKGPPVSIDVHTHWAPEGYLTAKADLGKPDFLDPINHDLPRRKQMMEASGIKMAVLTLGGFRPWQWVTPEQGADISRIANDAGIAAHQQFPETFLAAIELNCSDPAGSLLELNRVAGKTGMVCVHLPTALAARDYMFEPSFAPVLARIEDLNLPIILHPLDGEPNWFLGHRLDDAASGVDAGANAMANRFPGLTNSLGNSLEVAVTISKLIVSGTLDKYPALQFIATMGGGAMPYVMGRLEARSGNKAKLPVYTYLRRFYYDSLTFYSPSLRYLAEMVGTDRIVLGTDNMYGPGNQLTEFPHSTIDQSNFPDQDRDLILKGNLKRLFKI
jgi:aminocarboxymuconate-semialdehyde decarboxylase